MEDLFSEVLTELLPGPDQPPQPLMGKHYTRKTICGWKYFSVWTDIIISDPCDTEEHVSMVFHFLNSVRTDVGNWKSSRNSSIIEIYSQEGNQWNSLILLVNQWFFVFLRWFLEVFRVCTVLEVFIDRAHGDLWCPRHFWEKLFFIFFQLENFSRLKSSFRCHFAGFQISHSYSVV